MEVSQALDITPLEALLLSVRQAGGRAAWTDAMLAEAMRKHVEAGGAADEPSKQVAWWMTESRRERSLFGKLAKAAVDAALDALELTPEQRVAALGAAQERLLALEPGAGQA